MSDTPLSLVRYQEFLAEHKPEYVIGIDEVAFGCFAGPLVVCAVVLSAKKAPPVHDSKRYGSRKGLEAARDIVVKEGEAFFTYSASPQELDEVGLGKTLQYAFEAVAFQAAQAYPNSVVVLDGKNLIKSFSGVPQIAIPKADAYVPAVSCASVYAKTLQLSCMDQLDELYPEYGFHKHHGYGTSEHRRALVEHGVTPVHRTYISYVKKILAKSGTYEE